MLRLGAQTGYEIKRAIDHSTRFFWSASYGQIYPELHRLEERGLVRARPDPRGGLKRMSYQLTKKGESTLHEWLTDGDSYTFELRDEGLLRLFFSDLLKREEVLDNLRARIEFCDFVLERFREIEPDARTGFIEEEQRYPYLVLSYGIELMEFMRDWCEKKSRQIEAGELPPMPG
jgi:DNA-binding PadR family transcriptional regulator